MTFNIHHCKGIDKQVDLSRIAEVIENNDADIIVLMRSINIFLSEASIQIKLVGLQNN